MNKRKFGRSTRLRKQPFRSAYVRNNLRSMLMADFNVTYQIHPVTTSCHVRTDSAALFLALTQGVRRQRA